MKVIISLKLLISVICLGVLNVSGQIRNYPEVGKPISSFSLKGSNITNGVPITNTDLKGTHYILDFWSMGCVSCIASFPKMDSIQLKHGASLKIILVGLEEKKRNIQDFYKIYRRKSNLKITSVFDSVAFMKFVPSGVPHLIWVDNKGIVRAITTGSPDVNERNIEKFLKNQDFDFFNVSYEASRQENSIFDDKKPLLIGGNGGSDASYLRRSLISKWVQGNGIPTFPSVYPRKGDSNCYRFQVIGAPIDVLYRLAFFGKYGNILDTYGLPRYSEEALKRIEKNFSMNFRFNYSLEGPREVADVKSMMNSMQNDLASFFGLNAKMVHKPMPCYNLVVIDKNKFSKIIVSPGKPRWSWHAEDKVQSFKNTPLRTVLNVLKTNILVYTTFYNETDKNVNITFDMEVDIDDLESIRKGLQKVGLDLMPSVRLMRVIEVDVPQGEQTQVN